MLTKGQKEHRKWEKGKKLTIEEAVLSQCFTCFHSDPENRIDCGAELTCSLYPWSPYKGVDESID